ncbi:MAG: L,D-transpeptidase family protein [Thermaerobacter sp.]|nr:L,D-transpeptidase family protein [Thermaerobacter sp.]
MAGGSQVWGARHARVRGGSSRPWPYVAAGAVVVLVGAACYPRVGLAASGQALARVNSGSLGATVNNVRLSWAGGGVAAHETAGRIWPDGRVPAHRSVTVTATVAGPALLSWLPGYQQPVQWTVTTPSAPTAPRYAVMRALTSAHTVVPLGGRVARWRMRGTTGWQTWHTGPVTLSNASLKPGQTGRITLEALTRTWEQSTTTLSVRWQSPAYLTASATNATTITPTGSVVVQFSQPLVNAHPSQWTVTPNVPGAWKTLSPTQYQFTPSGSGFPPGSHVSVTVPGGPRGARTKSGTYLAKSWQGQSTVTPGSVTRMQQWLAALGYLPVTWTPQSGSTPNPNSPAIWQAGAGSFSWRWTTLPAPLTALWQPGVFNAMTQGALMQFQRVNGFAVTGVATGKVWYALEHAWLNKQMSPDGYSYILASETLPETLQVWVNGQRVMTTPTNTGIPLTPTTLGTFPIYERLPFQIMRGTNPNGSKYADPVYWINYFKGGEAVHGFVRASYGFPQSLGCVEVPPAVASTIYHDVHYGTLVTVLPPGAPA